MQPANLVPQPTRPASLGAAVLQPLPSRSINEHLEFAVVDVGSCAAAMRGSIVTANRWGQRVGAMDHQGCERAVLFDLHRVVDIGCLQAGDESSRALALGASQSSACPVTRPAGAEPG